MIRIIRGDNQLLKFTGIERYDATTSAYVDLLAADFEEAWLTFKTLLNDADADAVVQKKYSTGAITFSDTTSTASIVFAATDFASLDPNALLQFDLQFRLVGGKIQTAVIGQARIVGDVTKGIV